MPEQTSSSEQTMGGCVTTEKCANEIENQINKIQINVRQEIQKPRIIKTYNVNAQKIRVERVEAVSLS